MDDLKQELGTLAVNVQNIKALNDVKMPVIEAKAEGARFTAEEAKKAAENMQIELNQTKASYNEIKVKADEQDKLIQGLRDAQNDFIAQQKAVRIAGGSGIKSFEAEIEELLEKNKSYLIDAKERGIRNKFAVELQRKAVGNMGTAANITGSYFVPPDVKPGIVLRAYEDIHMRNLLPTGTTGSDRIRYVRDNGGEGGPTTVTEAGTKPQMDRDLSIEDAVVKKIATYMRIPEEMVDDIPYITSFLSNIGTQEVMKVEDTQILYGDGTGANLSGLFTNATAWADPGLVAGANRYDVLRAARLQMRKLFRTPSFALVSPLDYYLMTSVKDTTNNYVLQGGGNGLIPNLDGIPIIENTAVVDNDFLLVDKIAAEIDFRKSISVRFFEQDQDNAIKNMITIVIEERLALPIYYTSGLVKGTFTAAITALGT